MKLLSIFVFLSPLAVLTVIMMLIYATVQQSYRSNANDPQVQLAYDIRDRLSEGRLVAPLVPGDSLDIAKSLGVFIAFYDANGIPLKATGYLHGKMPVIPRGVFDEALNKKDDRVTWQPEREVRMAMVIVRVKSPLYSYLAVGRSLKEVEVRVGNLSLMVFIVWAVCIGILLIRGIILYKKQ